ncbi:MAG: helix-turn-helix transcriptional regulator [Solirubrobacteraceae bacterium]
MPRSRNPTLGATVRRLREERGFSREVLAVAAGVTTGTLARLELGQSDPAWSSVEAVADALGLSLAELAAAVESER